MRIPSIYPSVGVSGVIELQQVHNAQAWGKAVNKANGPPLKLLNMVAQKGLEALV